MTKATTALAACLLVAVHAEAVAGEFNVPQGGGRLPTIALVECLAEEGSRFVGGYCHTTYQCSPKRDGTDVSGTLWEGMTNHDGRLVTSGEDTIATERSCVLTVEDSAKVTFYQAYRPDGKGGEIVGFTRIGGPIRRTDTTGSYPDEIPPDNLLPQFLSDNMLTQFLSHGDVRAATLDDWLVRVCGDKEHPPQITCLTFGSYNGAELRVIEATDRTACYVDASIALFKRINHQRDTWLHSVHNSWERRSREECN